MQFDWTINFGQIVQTVSVVLALVGLALTYIQIRKTNTAHTAQVLKDVLFTFFSDPTLQKTYYKVGSGQFRFDRAKFQDGGSDEEREIDQLLYVFECVGRLHALGLIRKSDLLLRYRMTRVFTDPEIQAYLRYLDDEVYPKTLGPGTKAFRYARELVKVLGHTPRP